MSLDQPLEVTLSSLTGNKRGLSPQLREAALRTQVVELEVRLGEREGELGQSYAVGRRLRGALEDVVASYQGKQRAESTGLPSRAWLSLEEAIGQARGVLEHTQTPGVETKGREI